MQAAGGYSPPAALRRSLLAWSLALVVIAAACGDGDPAPKQPPATTTPTTPTTTLQASTSAPATNPPDKPFDLQGHRGARGLQPENTLPGFETALDLGVTTLELDLHFTADGRVVVWHDPIVHPDKCQLNPAATGADPATADETQLAIAALSRDQLANYDCNLNPDPGRFGDQTATGTDLAGQDYRIPTLDELFDFVAAYAQADGKTAEQRSGGAAVQFNIETKRVPDHPETINDGFDGVAPGPFELEILEIIAQKDISDRVVIQSFDHRSLRAIRSVDDSIRLAALTSRSEPFQEDFATFANIWSPDYRSLSAGSLETAQDAGLLVIPWTVNDPSDMNRLIDLGVDGLITDRPDLLVEVLAAVR